MSRRRLLTRSARRRDVRPRRLWSRRDVDRTRPRQRRGLTEIPDETAGPYPGDGSNGPDALEESGIVRSDIRSSFGASTTTAEGVPLEFELTILDMAEDNAPFVGVAVYAWHCDRAGRYSMYSEGVENENYLRGVQVTDAEGNVRFTSIVPACYSGRWPHVHFEVYPDEASITDSANAIATSQLAFPKDVSTWSTPPRATRTRWPTWPR